MYPVRLPIKSPWLCIFNDTIGAKILKAFLNKLRISREEKIAALTINVSEIAFSVNRRTRQTQEDSTIKKYEAFFVLLSYAHSVKIQTPRLDFLYLTQPSSQDRKPCSAPSLTYLLGTISDIFFLLLSISLCIPPLTL